MSWHQEIMKTFISVLTRPKFQIRLVSQNLNNRSCYSKAVIQLPDGSFFELTMQETSRAVYITCASNERSLKKDRSPCHYQNSFKKDVPNKVKKMALILAKKLTMKPVYDVMKA